MKINEAEDLTTLVKRINALVDLIRVADIESAEEHSIGMAADMCLMMLDDVATVLKEMESEYMYDVTERETKDEK